MEIIPKQRIDHFLDCKTMAIAGASRDERSFSAQVARRLSKIGYNLWYVNPQFEPGEAVYQRVQSIEKLPPGIKHMLVLTPKAQTESVVEQAIAKGIKDIWIQQQSETPEALMIAWQNQLNTVHHQCIFMFAEPEGIHKFHHVIKRIFGTMPK